ncbi:DUF4214 domain-containing protein [Aquihabitans sp. McL0605]|uniref:DUF4214 domain-containing protein n=1 Tax=Aquihabitans sp. McL0605 TaxID=3415671 RepID=UPI003CFB2E0D
MSKNLLFRGAVAGLALAAASAVVPSAASPAFAQGSHHEVAVTMRVSTDGAGTQPPWGSYSPALTPDGRFLAFEEVGSQQAWVEDLLTGQTEVVSKNAAGAEADDTVMVKGISADGNRVLFESSATNLIAGPHTAHDLFIRDRKANTLERANVDPNGQLSEVYDYQASMDESGYRVAWVSADEKVWTRNTFYPGTTQRVDVSSAEVGANGISYQAAISGDGNHVVFTSYGSNLIANDTNTWADVFERTVSTGTTVRASLGFGSSQASKNSNTGSVSKDGRYVAFLSDATDLVAGDTNLATDVFVHDLVNDVTQRVSLGATSIQGNGHANSPHISADGQSVLFRSGASNLVPGDGLGHQNWFERNLKTQFTVAVDQSLGLNLGNDEANFEGSISADGSVVAFVTKSSNLVAGDTNTRDDVFVRMVESEGPHLALSSVVNAQIANFGGAIGDAAPLTADLENGRIFVPHLISKLAHAPAWAANREPVARLYQAFFHREPDLNGLEYWVDKKAHGSGLSVIASSFAKSSEFKTHYGDVSDADFVKLVYQNVLDRPADKPGLAHWTAKMGEGLSRGGVMIQFSESSEGRRHLAPQVDAVLIGLGMLQKMPAKADYDKAVAAAAKGGPEAEAAYYLDSAAYYARY